MIAFRILPLLACAAVPGAAVAAEFVVYSSGDAPDAVPGDGSCDTDPSPPGFSCTLRAAVMEANALPGTDIINVNPGTYQISIPAAGGDDDATGDLNVTAPLTVQAAAYGVVINGLDARRIFRVEAGGSLVLRNLQVRDGAADYGGCIHAAANLTLDRVDVFSCSATSSGGGVFMNGGQLVVVDSWLRGNQSDSTGGALTFFSPFVNPKLARLERITVSGNSAFRGGGLYLGGETVVIDSTISTNQATDSAGGIFFGEAGRLDNVTVASNLCETDGGTVGSGGGLRKAVADVVTVSNSVLADNYCGNPSVRSDCSGTFASGGYNLLAANTACTGFTATGDQAGTAGSPLASGLGTLQTHGGWGPTRLPGAGSPLLQAGNPAGCTTDRDGSGPGAPTSLVVDQRGAARVADGRCEIGAVEVGPLFLDGFESGSTNQW